jgi:hypothetical protein
MKIYALEKPIGRAQSQGTEAVVAIMSTLRAAAPTCRAAGTKTAILR